MPEVVRPKVDKSVVFSIEKPVAQRQSLVHVGFEDERGQAGQQGQQSLARRRPD